MRAGTGLTPIATCRLTAADVSDLAPTIGAITVLACRDTVAAGVATRFSGCAPAPNADAPDPNNAVQITLRRPPTGVEGMMYVAPPELVAPLRAASLDEVHDFAIRSAWAAGAWDVNVTVFRPLSGVEVGVVLANRDFGEAPGLAAALVAAAESGRLATWSWRPMHCAPDIRARAWKDKDPTLRHDMSRAGNPPQDLVRPIWTWRNQRSWVLRLGRPTGLRSRVATGRQRAAIVAMHRHLGRRAVVPARLGFDRASVWIDALRAEIDAMDARRHE